MAELRREAIAVAGGAASGVTLSTCGQNHLSHGKRAPRRRQCEAAFTQAQIGQRLSQRQRRATALQAAEQGTEHVGRLVADREDLARLLELGGYAFRLEKRDRVLDTQRGQSRVQEPPRWAEGFHDSAVVRGMSDVAAGAARHEDLDAGPLVLLQ